MAAVADDPAAQNALYQEACAICLTCPSGRDCRNWLDAAECLPLPPDFCPNTKFFERCLLSQKDVH